MEKNLQIKIQIFFQIFFFPKNRNKHKISENFFFGSKHTTVDLGVIFT